MITGTRAAPPAPEAVDQPRGNCHGSTKYGPVVDQSEEHSLYHDRYDRVKDSRETALHVPTPEEFLSEGPQKDAVYCHPYKEPSTQREFVLKANAPCKRQTEPVLQNANKESRYDHGQRQQQEPCDF